MTEATIYVVDDDLDVGRALERLLRAAGYSPLTFQSAIDFLRAHDPARAGCLVLDQTMPILDGRQVQAFLAELGCTRPIIFLSGMGTIQLSVDAVRAGALNFLTKPVDSKLLLRAIEEALRVDAAQRSAQHEREELLRRLALLTTREREVLGHVVKGRMNKQIAGDLGTVEKTIKVHRARVMHKMQARSLAELVQLTQAADLGIDPAKLPADTARIATWDWDILNDRVIGDGNLARFFGLTEVDSDGVPLARYMTAVHPQDFQRLSSLIGEALHTGKNFEATYRVYGRDHEERIVVARGRAQYHPNGRPVRLTGLIVDITGH